MRQVHIKDVVGTERRLTRRLCSPVQPCGPDVNGTLRTKRANLSGERLTQDLYLRRIVGRPSPDPISIRRESRASKRTLVPGMLEKPSGWFSNLADHPVHDRYRERTLASSCLPLGLMHGKKGYHVKRLAH